MDTHLIALGAFALSASVTPGPNNIMAAATAANHGFRAAVPQMLGVAIGFAAMLAVVALGIAGVLAALPRLALAMRWASLAWLLWLAFKLARAAPAGHASARPPLGFLGAAAFQWVNPKAWVIALAASAAWVLPGRPMAPQVAALVLVFLAVTLPSIATWAAMGSAAARLLRTPRRLRAFNTGMAVLMVASMLPVAFE